MRRKTCHCIRLFLSTGSRAGTIQRECWWRTCNPDLLSCLALKSIRWTRRRIGIRMQRASGYDGASLGAEARFAGIPVLPFPPSSQLPHSLRPFESASEETPMLRRNHTFPHICTLRTGVCFVLLCAVVDQVECNCTSLRCDYTPHRHVCVWTGLCIFLFRVVFKPTLHRRSSLRSFCCWDSRVLCFGLIDIIQLSRLSC